MTDQEILERLGAELVNRITQRSRTSTLHEVTLDDSYFLSLQHGRIGTQDGWLVILRRPTPTGPRAISFARAAGPLRPVLETLRERVSSYINTTPHYPHTDALTALEGGLRRIL